MADEDEVILSYTEFRRLRIGSKVRARNGKTYEFTERGLGYDMWRAEDGDFRTENRFVLPVTLVHRG